MQVTDAPNLATRAKAMARFGHYFGGSLWDTYGSIARAEQVFNPDAPPRIKRPLRTSAPEIHFCRTSDHVELRLTRYKGGSKGPVMLVHGLGVSSRIFSIDTIDTNLVEYLFANGYDVWALDYRASIELPASKALATGDDVATKDYPAAIHKILQVTKADDVQVVAHCWGSTTLFMSLLAGLPNVRSLLASQIATHIEAPVMTKLKTGLHLPEFLQKIGVNNLTAYVDSHRDWHEVLYDNALKAYPTEIEEICNNPVCRRIAFMYAPLYEHAQLNKATHEAMHEMFGVANMKAFEHLATLVQAEHLVDAKGNEAYMPHLDRLNLPITFIHGAENACFQPRSTEITYNLLREKFGKEQYRRHLIPQYGHIDCIYGKNAWKDVFPHILAHLEKW
jgi:cholesterol oxidase